MSTLRRYGPGLYGWGRYQERWRFDFNGHALVGDAAGTVLVVDPIAPTEAELEAVSALGDRFLVVLLNSDHERDAARVSAALDAPIFAPEADLSALREGATGFRDGQILPGGWRVVGLPDLKTPGESVLHHAERRVLVVGDAVVGDPVHGMRLVPPVKIPDHAAAMRAVGRLLELDFDTLLLSDGYCLPQGGKAVIEAFVEAGLRGDGVGREAGEPGSAGKPGGGVGREAGEPGSAGNG